ncbi:unnamed protein product [Sympodiomycopsis kandeliae]
MGDDQKVSDGMKSLADWDRKGRPSANQLLKQRIRTMNEKRFKSSTIKKLNKKKTFQGKALFLWSDGLYA